MTWRRKAKPAAVQKCRVVIQKKMFVTTSAITRHSSDFMNVRTIFSRMRVAYTRTANTPTEAGGYVHNLTRARNGPWRPEQTRARS